MMIALLIPLMMLTGCADMNSKFDCSMRPGVRCESLDSVNAKVESGEIGHDGDLIRQSAVEHPASNVKKVSIFSDANFYQRRPLRYGETVQRIWMAPFEDTSGNYHQESYVYTIVRPSHWIGYPVKTMNEEE